MGPQKLTPTIFLVAIVFQKALAQLAVPEILYCNETSDEAEITTDFSELIPKSKNECVFTVKKRPEYCSIKIEFIQFISPNANAYGTCSDGKLAIRGSSTVEDGFEVCGNMDGQHMHLAFGRCERLDIRITNAQYKLQVHQIPCDASTRVPEHCLQYFTGTKGRVRSFGHAPVHAGGQQQNNQKYAVCVNDPIIPGSKITWRPCDYFSSDDNFVINGPSIGPPQCKEEFDWVQVNGKNIMCTWDQNDNVISATKPYILNVNFNDYEMKDLPFMKEILAASQSECHNGLLVQYPQMSVYYSECYWDNFEGQSGQCRCDFRTNAGILLPPVDRQNTGFCLNYSVD